MTRTRGRELVLASTECRETEMPKQVWPLKDPRPVLSEGPLRDLVRQQFTAKAERDAGVLMELLGRWVSELEPSIAYDPDYNIIGLSAPTGRIVVERIDARDFFLRMAAEIRTQN